MVKDQGTGISQDHMQKIYDPYFTTKEEGSGLGLAICKGFVEAHKGRVWLQSAQPGAIFGFTLPIEGACED